MADTIAALIVKLIADQTELVTGVHQANDTLSDFSDKVESTAEAIAGLFTAREVIGFIDDVVASAAALDNLSAQTHIGVEDIQVLASAMKDFGVDQEQLARGLFELGQKIAGGDPSVVTALHAMGMTLKDVQGLQGEELFLAIERGLSTLQGSLRDTTAADLFGTRLGGTLAGAADGIDHAIARAQQLNTVMSKESVQSLHEYSNAIDRAEESLKAMIANAIGPAAIEFNKAVDATSKGASVWEALKAVWVDAGLKVTGLGGNVRETDVLLQSLGESTQKASAASAKHSEEMSTEQKIAEFLKLTEKDAAQELTTSQVAALERMKELGELTAKNAAAIGVNAAQFQKYQVDSEKAAAAAKLFAEATAEVNSAGVGLQGTLDTIDGRVVEGIKYYLQAGVAQDKLATYYGVTATQVKAVATEIQGEVKAQNLEQQSVEETTKLWDEYYDLRVKRSGTATDAQLADIKRWHDDEVARAQKAGIDTAQFYDALEKDTGEKVHQVLVDVAALSQGTQQSLQDTADKAARTLDEALAHSADFTAEQIADFEKQSDAAAAAARNWGTQWASAADGVLATTEATASEVVATFNDAMGLVEQGLGTLTGQIQNGPLTSESKAAVQKAYDEGNYFGPVLNGTMANPRGTGPDFAALGYRAGGGDVLAGNPYIIGERGPELFVPGASGAIIPNAALGAIAGGGDINIHIHVGTFVGNDRAAARELATIVGDELLRRSGRRFSLVG